MSGRRLVDAVVPVVHLVATVEKLDALCCVEVLAEHAGPLEDGLQVLEELQESWGAEGELDALRDAPVGACVQVSWETLLLLRMVSPRAEAPDVVDLDLDVSHGTATRTGSSWSPTADEIHVVAVDLVAQEVQDAGCVAARCPLVAGRGSSTRTSGGCSGGRLPPSIVRHLSSPELAGTARDR